MNKKLLIVIGFIAGALVIGAIIGGVLLFQPDNAEQPIICRHDVPEKIEIVPAKAPTCVETGLTVGLKCTICDTMVTPQAGVPTIDCIESDWIIDEKLEGNRYTQCIYCGKVIMEVNIANDRLNAVMLDGAKGYEDITSSLTLPSQFVDPSESKRTATIVAVHKETSGLGYVIEVAWTSEDSHGSEPNLVLVGISTDGKIIAVNNEAYHDTEGYNIFNKDPNYASSFVGQDSTLADIGLVAGSTHSSSAFRSAVSHAFEVLVLNNMITAGVKSDDQILTEMLPLLHTGLANSGTIVGTEVAGSGNIVKGWKSTNNTGAAYIMSKGESMYLVLVNNSSVAVVYDTEKNIVTADHEDLITEALANFGVGNDCSSFLAEKLDSIIDNVVKDSIKMIKLDTFNKVSAAAEFTTTDGNTLYIFYSQPLTYQNNVMEVYTVIDSNGTIVKNEIGTFLYGHGVDYLPIYTQGYGNTSSETFINYENKYVGITEDTMSDDLLVTGATISSTAVRNATADAFEAFNSIKGGVQ